MAKFDPIDIFFIAIISAYFITLLCIFITIIYLKFSNSLNNKKSNIEELNKIEKTKMAITEEKTRDYSKNKNSRKLSDNTIIRKLFMKKVELPLDKKELNETILPETKIEIAENKTELIDAVDVKTAKVEKENKTIKAKSNSTKKKVTSSKEIPKKTSGKIVGKATNNSSKSSSKNTVTKKKTSSNTSKNSSTTSKNKGTNSTNKRTTGTTTKKKTTTGNKTISNAKKTNSNKKNSSKPNNKPKTVKKS